MKTIIKINSLPLAGLLLAMVFLSSCLKDKNQLNDFSELSTQPVVELQGSGLSNFAINALNFNSMEPDTLMLYVNLASTQTFDKDLTVNVGIDTAALNSYNATSTIKYSLFPDSIYLYKPSQVTIKAGERRVGVPVIVYPDKIDATNNYMLPISVKDAGGATISGNFGTMYYHLIGNPLAGTYNWDFTGWSNPTQTGSPDGTSFTRDVTTLSPVSPTQLEVSSGYYIGPRYEITFDNDNGVLSNFKVSMNAEDLKSMSDAGVIVTNGPNIIIADPVKKVFEFQYTTLTRYVIDKYYK